MIENPHIVHLFKPNTMAKSKILKISYVKTLKPHFRGTKHPKHIPFNEAVWLVFKNKVMAHYFYKLCMKRNKLKRC